MGVDAELYLWGEEISTEDLQGRERKALAQIGLSKYEKRLITPCTWWDDDLSLYQVSLDGARYFSVGNDRGFTGWPTIMRRIRIIQPLFPEHFLIYTNDHVTFERLTDGSVLTEEKIQEIDTDWWARRYC